MGAERVEVSTRLSDRHILACQAIKTRRQIMSDPIFAAIETYRAAWTALEKGCERLDDESTPETEAEFDRLNDAAEEAACTLADTQPTSVAGAVALLRHAAEYEDTFESLEDEDDGKMKPWSYFMHQTLATALEEMKAST
jgi:hypothetical protein